MEQPPAAATIAQHQCRECSFTARLSAVSMYKWDYRLRSDSGDTLGSDCSLGSLLIRYFVGTVETYMLGYMT